MAALASAAASLATMTFAPTCWACCDLLLRPDGNAPRKCFLASVARPVGRAQQLGAQQEVTSENILRQELKKDKCANQTTLARLQGQTNGIQP